MAHLVSNFCTRHAHSILSPETLEQVYFNRRPFRTPPPKEGPLGPAKFMTLAHARTRTSNKRNGAEPGFVFFVCARLTAAPNSTVCDKFRIPSVTEALWTARLDWRHRHTHTRTIIGRIRKPEATRQSTVATDRTRKLTNGCTRRDDDEDDAWRFVRLSVCPRARASPQSSATTEPVGCWAPRRERLVIPLARSSESVRDTRKAGTRCETRRRVGACQTETASCAHA